MKNLRLIVMVGLLSSFAGFYAQTVTTYTVTSVADVGAGTIRDALTHAIADASTINNTATILFNASGLCQLQSSLPAINNLNGTIIMKPDPSASPSVAQGVQYAGDYNDPTFIYALLIGNNSSSHITINGITFDGFYGVPYNGRVAIEYQNTTNVTISNCIFSNCRDGMDIFYLAVNDFVSNNSFISNANSFTGVYYGSTPNSTITFSNNNFQPATGLTSTSGGGIEITSSSNAGEQLTITNNIMNGLGMGLEIINYNTNPTSQIVNIANNTFSNSSLGALLYDPNDWIFTNNKFIANQRHIQLANPDGHSGCSFNMIESTSLSEYIPKNTGNTFQNCTSPISMNINYSFDNKVTFVGLNLDGALVISQPGTKTIVRATNITSVGASNRPIELTGNGNNGILAPIPVINGTTILNTTITLNYTLPASLNIANGPFAVDFYRTDGIGDLLGYLGTQTITTLTGGNYQASVSTNGFTFATGDVIGLTVTSLGTNNASALGTSEAAYATITGSPCTIIASVGSNVSICNGSSTNLSASGGTSYSWAPSTGLSSAAIANPTANPTTTTIYTVTVNNSPTCSQTTTVTVTVNPLPTVTSNTTVAAACSGGSVTLTGSGAVSYVWTGGISDGVSFVPLSTTTYTVTGTDINGCTATSSISITVNPLPTVIANTSTSSVCFGNGVTLTGTGAQSYFWTGGVSDGVTFIPSSTNTYTVTGTDTNGCTSTSAVAITVNPLPTIIANTSASSVCFGNSVILSGGGALTYTWSGRAVEGIAITPSVSTTYTVTGTDANGCTASSTVAVTVNSVPVVTANTSATTICAGSNVTLTGGGAENYVWSGGVNNGVAFVPSSTSTYTVTATASDGCSNTAAVTVTINPPPIITVSPSAPSSCEGTVVTLTASGASTYSWSTGTTGATISVNPSSTTTYTVTGTTSVGCSNTASVTVTLPVVIANASATTVCTGTSVTLTGSGATSYTWSGGVRNGVAFKPTATTTYTVTGTTSGGCKATSTVIITVNPLPIITVMPHDTTICDGTPVTLTATGAVSYSWTGRIINGVAFTPTATSNYTVTGTDANGCQNTATDRVSFHTLPKAKVHASATTIDSGQSVTLRASGAQNVIWTGGVVNGVAFVPTATSTYTATVIDAYGCSSTSIITVRVKSPAGNDYGICATYGSPSHSCCTVGANLCSPNYNQITICNGETVQFSATFLVGNNYPAFYWIMNPITGVTISDLTNPSAIIGNGIGVNDVVSATFTLSGIYSIDYYDNNGNQIPVAPMQITVLPLPNPPTFTLPTSACVGTSICISNPSLIPVSIDWNDGPVINFPCQLGQQACFCHTYFQPGNYTVTFTGSNGGCSASSTTTVIINDVTAGFTVEPLCPGSATIFTDMSKCETPNIPNSDSWSWNFGDPSSANNTSILQSPTHIYMAAGTYTVTMTITDNISTKSNTTSQTVVIIAQPTPVIFGNIDNCTSTGTTTYNVKFNRGYHYVWSFPRSSPWVISTNADGNIATVTWNPNPLTPTPIPLTGTTLTVIETNASGCSSSATITVFQCCSYSDAPRFNDIIVSQHTSLFDPDLSKPTGTSYLLQRGGVINGTLTVDRNLTIENLAPITGITYQNFLHMGPLAKIVVKSPYTLTIATTAGAFGVTTLEAGCGYMWDGIYVEPGASLIINSSSNVQQALIMDAVNGVVLVNGASASNYTINNTNFLNDYIGIQVEKYALSMPATNTITQTKFIGSGSLKYPPKLHKASSTGIRVTDVYYYHPNRYPFPPTNSGITIGDNFRTPQAKYQNYFTQLDTGISVIRSYADIYNCQFINLNNNLSTYPNLHFTGIGICSRSVNKSLLTPFAVLNVGDNATKANPAVATINNIFTNCEVGVYADNYVHLTVTGTKMTQMAKYGIYSVNDYDSLQYNNITMSPVPNNRVFLDPIGIEVDKVNPHSNYPVLIANNSIHNPVYGIVCTNLTGTGLYGTGHVTGSRIDSNSVNWESNSLVYKNQFGLGWKYAGIFLYGCNNIFVDFNKINVDAGSAFTPNATNQPYVTGIEIEASPTSKVSLNTLKNLGDGIVSNGVNTNSQLACNSMTNCYFGINFTGTGGFSTVGAQLSGNVQQGNTWNGTITSALAGQQSPPGSKFTYYNVAPYIPAPLTAAYNLNSFIPNPQSFINNNCSNNTYPELRLQASAAAQTRNQQFGAIVNNLDTFPMYNSQTYYGSKQYAYRYFKANPAQLSLGFGDSAYVAFYDSVQATAVGAFELVNDLIDSNNISGALALNASAPVSSQLDANRQTVNNIYLNTWLSGINTFDSTQYTTLYNIAVQDPLLASDAVYSARVLLGLNFFSTGNIGTRMMEAKNTTPVLPIKGKVYPNPNDGNMQFDYSLSSGSKGDFVIYTLSGVKVADYWLTEGDNVSLRINEATLSSGLYFYSEIINGAVVTTGKLVIIK